MPELALLPERVRSRRDKPEPSRSVAPQHRYFAFLSYSHRDETTADWLHDELEQFRVPSPLVGRLTDNGAIPKRLTPIFRDRRELAAATDLNCEIRDALAASRFMIVLCSPAAAQSHWTNAEVDAFKRSRPDGCVLAAIVDGEPFASDIPGREAEECLPPALRIHYDRRGRPTGRRAEPLAADLREGRDGRRLGLLKIVAGMLGIGLDELVQRETLRRHRHMAVVAAASIVGMAVTTTLAVTAIDARDAARDQRREAEGLVGFMLGDLRSRLEPIGRLDVLDSVGTRALDYYRKQDKSRLSDESLAQRSKALTLMGEIANTRGDLGRALQLYREAYAGTAEAVRRDPQNPERLFDHAQNVFWVGYIDWQRGRLPAAERSFREYKNLAERMQTLEPGNPKWRLEGKYADNNLGTVLFEQNRFAEAAMAFQQALATVEALAASEPQNREYQNALLEALAWLADARKGEGRLEEAMAQRERQLGLLQRLIAASPEDTEYKRKAMTAHAALSRLLAGRGDMPAALSNARRAAAYADSLVGTEPNNTEWMEFAAASQLHLGTMLRVANNHESAASAIRAGCDMATRLIAKDSSVGAWSEYLRLQCLSQRARLALARNAPDEALGLARQTLAVAQRSRGKTRIEGATNRASAYQLYGDALAAAGQTAAARTAWSQAAGSWPRNVGLLPEDLADQAQSLRSAGHLERARQVAAQLDAIGYRHPEFLRLRARLMGG